MSAKIRQTRMGHIKITLTKAAALRLNAILWTGIHLGDDLCDLTDSLDDLVGKPSDDLQDSVREFPL